jgi:hypothetical protein
LHYTLKLGVTGLLPPGAVIAASKLGVGPAAANGGVKLGAPNGAAAGTGSSKL